jgi:hypothetical protein
MATTITPTDVITEYGAYYIDQGQNMQSLLMRPFHAFGTRDAFTNMPTKDTQLRWADVEVGEILQRYQDTYTAKGSVTFTPVKIDLTQVKIDQSFNPNNLVYSWLGFLTSTNTDRTTWPFIRWFIEVYLLQKLWEDMESQVIYTGVQAAITPGTATAANGVIDGVKKIINDGIADMTSIPTGAFAADPVDFVTQIEEFVKQVDKKFWNSKMTLNMNQDRKVQFVEGMQKKYNTYYAQVPETMAVRNFSNIMVKGRQSMDGSDKIWMTPIENAVFAVKGFENANGFELEKVDRTVKIWTDFHFGIGFLLKDLVFTNDLDM